ncbi:MAG: type IV pilus biogenesis protein PilM [Patescibacteria group bacterium]|jgi:hypothetical protein
MVSSVLVFSSSQIQFLQLDAHKKQIVAAVTQPLAQGSIKRGKIEDKVAVTQAVTQVVKAAKTSLSEITLIIPEDTAISKSLEIPKLPDKEADEAVRWEAENVLPYPLESVVLDWQVVSTNGKHHILFLAVPQEVVDAYIKVIESQSIRVAAVETPALALVRLAEAKPGIRLLVHVSQTEAILTLTKNQEVVATSLIPVTTQLSDHLKQTILHMCKYYRNFPVEWIQIGGMGVTTQLVESLSELKLPISGYAMSITVKPEVANNYLLAISGALKNVALPSDQKTINLLPQWYVSSYTSKQNRRFWTKLLIVWTLFTAILFISLGGVYLWLLQKEREFTQNLNSPSSIRKEALAAAGAANQASQRVQVLSATDYFPTITSEKIKSLTNSEITLGKIQLSLPEKKGTVMGMASDRQAMVTFKQALEDLPEINEVQLPVSSFAEGENIPFQLFFTLSSEIGKTEVGDL